MKTRLAALALIIGVAMASSAGAVHARGIERAEMVVTFTLPDGITVPDTGEAVTYFGTVDFGDGDVYAMAFYAATDPVPLFGDWVRGSDRWEIFGDEALVTEAQAVIDGAVLTAPPSGDVIAGADDRWIGNGQRNVYYGIGPGGAWSGSFTSFVDPPPGAPPGTPPTPNVFEGPFWLFGELDD